MGLLGSDNGRKRDKCSVFNNQSSVKVIVKRCQLGMGPLAMGTTDGANNSGPC